MQLCLELEPGVIRPGGRIRGTLSVFQGGSARSLTAAVVRRDTSHVYTEDRVADSAVLAQGDLRSGAWFPVDLAVPDDVHVPLVTSNGALWWLVTVRADRAMARDAVAEQPLQVPLPPGARPPTAPARPVVQRPPGVKETHHRSRPPLFFVTIAAGLALFALTTLRSTTPLLVLLLAVAAGLVAFALVRRRRGPREAERLSVQAPDRARRGEPLPVELGLGGVSGFESLRAGLVLHERYTFRIESEDRVEKRSRERALFETWVPVPADPPVVTLAVPADAMPTADGVNLSLRWEVVAAGEREGQERIARRPLLVGL